MIKEEPAKTCETNEHGILPFRVQKGCPTPSYCTATSEIVDAWSVQKRGKGTSFGLALKVSIPNRFRDSFESISQSDFSRLVVENEARSSPFDK